MLLFVYDRQQETTGTSGMPISLGEDHGTLNLQDNTLGHTAYYDKNIFIAENII